MLSLSEKCLFGAEEPAIQRFGADEIDRREHSLLICRPERANFDLAAIAKLLYSRVFRYFCHNQTQAPNSALATYAKQLYSIHGGQGFHKGRIAQPDEADAQVVQVNCHPECEGKNGTVN
jgi:hypothetical protein